MPSSLGTAYIYVPYVCEIGIAITELNDVIPKAPDIYIFCPYGTYLKAWQMHRTNLAN